MVAAPRTRAAAARACIRKSLLPAQAKGAARLRPKASAASRGKDSHAVGDLHELDRCHKNLASDKLATWIKIVAYGSKAKCASGQQNLIQCHSPAVSAPADVALHAQFASKHARLSRLLKTAAASKDSRWKIYSAGGPSTPKGCKHISNLPDLRDFLAGIRILPNIAGVQATYIKPDLVQTAIAMHRKRSAELACTARAPPPKVRSTGPCSSRRWVVRAVAVRYFFRGNSFLGAATSEGRSS